MRWRRSLTASLSITFEDGICVNYEGKKIVLDPSRPKSDSVSFISHAHLDHLQGVDGQGVYLCSKETKVLAEKRGVQLGKTIQSLRGFEMPSSGHILGSTSLLFRDKFLYTGDLCTRQRGFQEPTQPIKCSTLVIESTFGRSQYRFPPLDKVVEQTHRLIAEHFAKGIPVVLMGYPLGKAQILTHLFSSWEPIFLHDSVKTMNDAYAELGKNLPGGLLSYSDASEKGLLEKKPWILLAPMSSSRSSFLRTVRNLFGAVLVGFTGWAVEQNGRPISGVDYSLPLSDHADFYELEEFVKKCSPDRVYVVHGFADEFASHLRSLGFDAKPIVKEQKHLSDYMVD